MPFKTIAIVLSILAIQANCACVCGGCGSTGGSNSGSSSGSTISIAIPALSCPAPSAPTVSVSSGPSLTLPAPTVTYPSSSGCSSGNSGSSGSGSSFPTSIQCPTTPAPQINQQPDVELGLPFPAEIPLGQYCNCQKYVIRPKIVPCA